MPAKSLLASRSTAGLLTLDQLIGVRIPGGQLNFTKEAILEFTPLSDNVVVKVSDRPTTTNSGLYIPQNGNDATILESEVLSVGPGRVTQNGALVEPKVQVGDKVWFPKFNATEIKLNSQTLYVVSEQYILGFSRKL